MMARPVPPSAGTAKTLILIGLILQLLFVLLFLGLAAAILATVPFGGFAVVILLPFVVIGLLILALVYLFTYRRVADGDYEGARTPTLIWGIICLFISTISGILYIVAYVKLGDAVREMQTPPYTGTPPTYAAPGMPYAPAAPAAAPPAPPAPNCPKCGRPGTWVAQYNRFYCYTDQQYL